MQNYTDRPADEPTDQDFLWWEKIINYAADYMLGRILQGLGFDDNMASALWRLIMDKWSQLSSKLLPEDERLRNSQRAYAAAAKRAIEIYRREGGSPLYEKIMKDLQALVKLGY
jgi:hypothetical protein